MKSKKRKEKRNNFFKWFFVSAFIFAVLFINFGIFFTGNIVTTDCKSAWQVCPNGNSDCCEGLSCLGGTCKIDLSPSPDPTIPATTPSTIIPNNPVPSSNTDIPTTNSIPQTSNIQGVGEDNLINLQTNDELSYKGYIVELTADPLIIQKQQYASRSRSLSSSMSAKQINTIKKNLNTSRNTFKKRALSTLSKTSVVTGNAVSGKVLQVLGEYSLIFNGLALNITSAEAEKIKKISGVKAVYPNYIVHAVLSDSVPMINADDVWNLDSNGNNCATSGKQCLTGKGITIGIIDTGVDYTHQDLGGCFGTNCKVVGGYDFVNNDNNPMDDMGHGTHCAATAAGNGILKGVAPDAKIYAYKVLDSSGSGYNEDIISAIERATDPNQDGDTSDHLDIISLSLGGKGNPDDPTSKAIDNAVSAGVVAVIAAGNSGPSEQTIGSPGTARKAITIGAMDKLNQLAYFSSRGPVIWTDEFGNQKSLMKPDVVAPGVYICAAYAKDISIWNNRKCLDNTHVAISGTSMATPHVAGAVALIKQAHPSWTPEEIKSALKNTAVSLGPPDVHLIYPTVQQGTGKIDVLNTVKSINIQESWNFGIYTNQKIFNNYNKIQINGIFPENYAVIDVSWIKDSNPENQFKSGVNILGKNGIIVEFNPVGLITENGDYTFTVSITKNGVTKKDFIKIYFDKDLKNGWPITLFDNQIGGYSADSSPIIEDLNNDDNNELIVSSNGDVYVFDSYGALLPGWPRFTGNFQSRWTPAIADINQDGFKEIIVSSGSNYYGLQSNTLNIWNYKGEKINGWEEGKTFYLWIHAPTLSDINNDKYKEIIVGDGNGTIYVYNYKGNLLWSKQFFEIDNDNMIKDISVGDLDNDGNIELIVPSNLGKIFILNNNGDLINSIDCGQFYLNSLILADINNDSKLEILVTSFSFSTSYYQVFDSQGNQILKKEYNGLTISTPSVGDVNNDSNLEVFFDQSHYLIGLDALTGETLIGWPQSISTWANSVILIADLNGDNYREIITGNSNGKIFMFNYDGSLYKQKETDGKFIGSISLGDIDNDGVLDLFAHSYFGRLYAWSLKDSSSSSKLDWPMFMHDPQHTGAYTLPTISCNSFTYSPWSACGNGQQTRTILSSSPSGCTGGSPSTLTQNCLGGNGNSCQSNSQCSSELSCREGICQTTPFCTSFTYSPWSACGNGQQTRTILSSSPSGCTGGSPESLIGDCFGVKGNSCQSNSQCSSELICKSGTSCQPRCEPKNAIATSKSQCCSKKTKKVWSWSLKFKTLCA